MGNPKIATLAYSLAAGFILVVALYSSPRAVITAIMPAVMPVSDLKWDGAPPPGRAWAQGKEVNSDDPPDERVVYLERFQGVYFDFRGKSIFTRYDRCEFVKCTLLIDHATEQLAFTACVFKDCNIDQLQPDEARGLYVIDNFFDRPLDERRDEFEIRLAQVLAMRRKANGK
jgi:hypothetical protein